LGVKKKINFKKLWQTSNVLPLSKISIIQKGSSITKAKTVEGIIPVIAGGQEPAYFHNTSNRDGNVITVSASGAYSGFLNYWKEPIFASDCNTIVSKDEKIISTKLLFEFLKSIQSVFYSLQRGQAQPHVYASDIEKIKVPLPPISIQQKIITKIEEIEQKEKIGKENIKKLREQIKNRFVLSSNNGALKKMEEICQMKAGKFVSASDIYPNKSNDFYPCYGGNGQRGYTKTYTHQGKYPLVGRQGALCGNVHLVEGVFHATEHALVVTPIGNVNIDWLYYLLKEMNLNQYATGTAQPGLSVKNIKPIVVKISNIKEQEQATKEIISFEKQITQIETELSTIAEQKEQVLKKYLE